MTSRKRDPLAELEAFARATADMRPSDELTEAVMRAVDPVAETLARAARQTEDLAPSPDFTSAVMRAVGREATASPWPFGVIRWGRVALLGAAAAAAFCVLLASRAENDFDRAILEGVAAVEVDE